jgi:hypothetical protein
VTILDKYNADKGCKAFSYFSVITKNWFIHKVKKVKNNKDVSLDDLTNNEEEDYISYEYDIIEQQDSKIFMSFFLEREMLDWSEMIETDVEKKVFDALTTLFANAEDIQIFNKKAIYLYMREITGLNTKQIVAGLKKFRKTYKGLRSDWDNGRL